MGYGASSKGGGGSGSAGGGKKKSGRGSKPKMRNFKVKQKVTSAASPSPPSPAFTVREPTEENRARLLEVRRQGERAAKDRNEALRRPVNGTGTCGRTLGSGSGSETHGENSTVSTEASGNQQLQQRQQNAAATEREARLAFFAAKEAEAEVARRDRSKAERARRDDVAQRRFGPQMALARQQLDVLAERLGGREASGDVRHLLEVVLLNAATKPGAKYRVLRASNNRLWTQLLQFPEAVVILEGAAGFERREGAEKRKATAAIAKKEMDAVRIQMEKDQLQQRISQALDNSSSTSTEPNTPDAVASMIADLEALVTAPAEPEQIFVEEERDFELHYAGAGNDGIGVERALAILRTITTW